MRSLLLAALALVPAAALAQTTPIPAPVPAAAPQAGMVDAPCLRPPAPRAPADWPWLCRYTFNNAAVNDRPTTVFMGDSITEFWLALDPAFFAAGRVDRGISGQTTPQMLLRFWQDVIALKPRAVHIMGGTNDIAGNTGPNSPEQYRNNIRAMVDLAQSNGIRVVIGSIPPAAKFDWAPQIQTTARIVELNKWLKAFAAEKGAVFADYYSVLATPEGAMKPGLSSDGVHPSADGYKVMRPVAEAALKAALQTLAKPAR